MANRAPEPSSQEEDDSDRWSSFRTEVEDEHQEDLKQLDQWMFLCIPDADGGGTPSTAKHVARARDQLAEACFSNRPDVARKALRCLQRVLANSTVGDADVAFGLVSLAKYFMSHLSDEHIENMPQNLRMAMTRCMFSILEAVEAEWLIGNLPSISASTRKDIYELCERIEQFTSQASKRDYVSGLSGDASDVLANLWLETLLQLTHRMSHMSSRDAMLTAVAQGAKALGATIQLYQGNVAAGLGQFMEIYKESATSAKESWFESVVLLRGLMFEALKDEVTFRRLKNMVRSGLVNSLLHEDGNSPSWFPSTLGASVEQKPRLMMHFILGLQRLIESGCTDHVRKESFMLIVDFVLSESPYLQFTAAQVLEHLGESDGSTSDEVKPVAKALLVIVEYVVFSQSLYPSLRDYSARLRAQREGEAVTPPDPISNYFFSVVLYAFGKLNDGKPAKGGSMVSIASGLSSRHAGKVMEAVKKIHVRSRMLDELTRVDPETNLTPLHQACQSGVVENVQWMLQLAGDNVEQLVRSKLVSDDDWLSGSQPIHLAGSIEVLELLLDNRANLRARTTTYNTILHTLQSATVLDYVLENKKAELEDAQERTPFFNSQSQLFSESNERQDSKEAREGKEGQDEEEEEEQEYPPVYIGTPNRHHMSPLLRTRNYEVTRCLIKHLIKHSANIKDAKTGCHAGMTALMFAAQQDHAGACKALIEYDPGLITGEDGRDHHDRTVLWYAGTRSLPVLMNGSRNKMFLDRRDDRGDTALFACHHPDIARQLCEMKASVRGADHENDLGQTALSRAFSVGASTQYVQCLIRYRADLEVPATDVPDFGLSGPPDFSIFASAVKHGYVDVVLQLAEDEQRRRKFFNARCRDGLTVADHLCKSPGAAMAYVLSVLDVDRKLPKLLSTPNKWGSRPLGQKGIQRSFLRDSAGLDTNNLAKDFKNQALRQTYLHLCDFKDMDEVLLLLEQQADAAAVDALGQSVLWHAVHGVASAEVVQRLLESRAEPKGGHSLVLAWARSGLVDVDNDFDGGAGLSVLNLLLEARCSINERDDHLCVPPLCGAVAVWQESAGITTFDVLVKHRADANVSDALGQTPLSMAVRTGYLELVRKVLPLCREVSSWKDVSGMTPRQLAESLGFEDVYEELPEELTSEIHRAPSKNQATCDPFLLARLGLSERFLEAVSTFTEESQWTRRCPLSGYTLLQAAIQGGSLDLLNSILAQCPGLVEEMSLGADCASCQTPLEILARASPVPEMAYEMAKALVESRADPAQESSDLERKQKTLLFAAAESGNPGVLRLLLEEGKHPDVNKTKAPWPGASTVLPVLCFCTAKGCARLLVEYEAQVGHNHQILAALPGINGLKEVLEHVPPSEIDAALSRDGRSPLFHAASPHHVQLLLDKKASVNKKNHNGETPLFALVRSAKNALHGTRMVEALLKARCNANEKNSHGNTPLYFLNSCPVADLLLGARADLFHENVRETPCGLACARSAANMQSVKSHVEGNSEDTRRILDMRHPMTGMDMVLTAAEADSPEPLKLLIQMRADIFSSVDNKGENILHKAVRAHLSITEFVLQEAMQRKDYFKLLRSRDDDDASIVHKAVLPPTLSWRARWSQRAWLQPNSRQLLKCAPSMVNTWPLLLVLHACKMIDESMPAELVNAQDRHGRSPLDGLGCLQTAQTLLDAGADPVRALAHIPDPGNLQLVDLLIAHRADINARKSHGQLPIQAMVKAGDLPLLEAWVDDRGADVHFVDARGDGLMAFVRHTYMKQELEKRQLDVNQQNPVTGNTLMHILTQEGNVKLLGHLLRDPDVKVTGNTDGQSLLHIASMSGHVHMAEFLREKGFSLRDTDGLGCTPLHRAVQSGHHGMVQYLIRARSDINARDNTDNTPLVYAIRSDDSLAVLDELLQMRADVAAEAENGLSSLHIAADCGSVYALKELLKPEWGLDINRRAGFFQRSVLHQAVLRRHLSIVDELLQWHQDYDPWLHQLDTDAGDSRGDTAATLAAQSGAKNILDRLCAYSADHVAPFLAAVKFGQKPCVELLIQKYGLKPSLCFESAGNNALHLCARYGHGELADYILENWAGDVLEALCHDNHENQTPCDVAGIHSPNIQRHFEAHCVRHKIDLAPRAPRMCPGMRLPSAYACCFSRPPSLMD